MNNEVLYVDYLSCLKINEITDILNDYNKLCDIYNGKKVVINKQDKMSLIKQVLMIRDIYLRYFIMSLDYDDYLSLKTIISNNYDLEFVKKNKEFVRYLSLKKVLFQKDTLELIVDMVLLIKDILRSRKMVNYIKKQDKYYKIAEGIIIAYGVIDRKNFEALCPIDINILNYYYKKDYVIESRVVINKKLLNQSRIQKYMDFGGYKKFSKNDYYLMSSLKYHHKIKAY